MSVHITLKIIQKYSKCLYTRAATSESIVKIQYCDQLPLFFFFGDLPSAVNHFLSTRRELEVPEFTSLHKFSCLKKEKAEESFALYRSHARGLKLAFEGGTWPEIPSLLICLPPSLCYFSQFLYGLPQKHFLIKHLHTNPVQDSFLGNPT